MTLWPATTNDSTPLRAMSGEVYSTAIIILSHLLKRSRGLDAGSSSEFYSDLKESIFSILIIVCFEWGLGSEFRDIV